MNQKSYFVPSSLQVIPRYSIENHVLKNETAFLFCPMQVIPISFLLGFYVTQVTHPLTGFSNDFLVQFFLVSFSRQSDSCGALLMELSGGVTMVGSIHVITMAGHTCEVKYFLMIFNTDAKTENAPDLFCRPLSPKDKVWHILYLLSSFCAFP